MKKTLNPGDARSIFYTVFLLQFHRKQNKHSRYCGIHRLQLNQYVNKELPYCANHSGHYQAVIQNCYAGILFIISTQFIS
jgi:hypothetical protein